MYIPYPLNIMMQGNFWYALVRILSLYVREGKLIVHY